MTLNAIEIEKQAGAELGQDQKQPTSAKLG